MKNSWQHLWYNSTLNREQTVQIYTECLLICLTFLKSIYRLSCSSGVCGWTELGQKLKRKRNAAVAFPLLTSMVACKGEEKEEGEEGEEGEHKEENRLAEPFSNTFEIMDEIGMLLE